MTAPASLAPYTRMPVARLAELLNDRIADLAPTLLGPPNRELSSAQQLRFGTKGSVAVAIAGNDAGRWYDHEAERAAQGKTSGTVRIEDAGVVVIADLPKKVT